MSSSRTWRTPSTTRLCMIPSPPSGTSSPVRWVRLCVRVGQAIAPHFAGCVSLEQCFRQVFSLRSCWHCQGFPKNLLALAGTSLHLGAVDSGCLVSTEFFSEFSSALLLLLAGPPPLPTEWVRAGTSVLSFVTCQPLAGWPRTPPSSSRVPQNRWEAHRSGTPVLPLCCVGQSKLQDELCVLSERAVEITAPGCGCREASNRGHRVLMVIIANSLKMGCLLILPNQLEFSTRVPELCL